MIFLSHLLFSSHWSFPCLRQRTYPHAFLLFLSSLLTPCLSNVYGRGGCGNYSVSNFWQLYYERKHIRPLRTVSGAAKHTCIDLSLVITMITVNLYKCTFNQDELFGPSCSRNTGCLGSYIGSLCIRSQLECLLSARKTVDMTVCDFLLVFF